MSVERRFRSYRYTERGAQQEFTARVLEHQAVDLHLHRLDQRLRLKTGSSTGCV